LILEIAVEAASLVKFNAPPRTDGAEPRMTVNVNNVATD